MSAAPSPIQPASTLLHDRVAIVTGVGPGLGRDIAMALAADGAKVAVAARSVDRLHTIVAEIETAGGEALAVPTDITNAEQCKNLVHATIERFGKLNVLVNSAFRQPPFDAIEEVDEISLRKGFETNFFGHVSLTQAAIPFLRTAAPSSIVFINTMSTRRSRPGFGVYTASKMALLGMAKVLATEVGPDRIRVNSVHPGYIWGDSVKWYINSMAEQRGVDFDTVYDEIAGDTALRWLPGSDEIAQAVVFLACERMSSSITGESIDVNSGQYIR